MSGRAFRRLRRRLGSGAVAAVLGSVPALGLRRAEAYPDIDWSVCAASGAWTYRFETGHFTFAQVGAIVSGIDGLGREQNIFGDAYVEHTYHPLGQVVIYNDPLLNANGDACQTRFGLPAIALNLDAIGGSLTDLEGVALHEMGHRSGLWHTGRYDNINGPSQIPTMTGAGLPGCIPAYSRSEYIPNKTDDRAGIAATYSSSLTSNVGMENAALDSWKASGSLLQLQGGGVSGNRLRVADDPNSTNQPGVTQSVRIAEPLSGTPAGNGEYVRHFIPSAQVRADAGTTGTVTIRLERRSASYAPPTELCDSWPPVFFGFGNEQANFNFNDVTFGAWDQLFSKSVPISQIWQTLSTINDLAGTSVSPVDDWRISIYKNTSAPIYLDNVYLIRTYYDSSTNAFLPTEFR